MEVASSASSKVGAGKSPGTRLASIVLPAPGGPTRSALWPPAAAISSARLQLSCPRTSERSRADSSLGGGEGGCGGSDSVPDTTCTASTSVRTAWTRRSFTSAASAPF